MAKLTLTNLTTLANDTSAVNTINNNMALIIQAMDKALFRTGELPHVMLADLDLGSKLIINLRPPNNPSDGATKKYVDDLLGGTTDPGAAQLRADLADTTAGKGASLVGIEDATGFYLSTTVEGALDELPTILASNITGKGASLIGVEDPTSKFTATDVEGVVSEIHDRGRYGSWSAMTTTAAVDTYIVTATTPTFAAYLQGDIYSVNFVGANTSPTPTLDINSIGALPLLRIDGSAVTSGQIYGNHLVKVVGATMIVLNPNPVGVAAGFRGAEINRGASYLVSPGTGILLPMSSTTYDTDSIWSLGDPTKLTVPVGVSKIRIVYDVNWLTTEGSFTSFVHINKGVSDFGLHTSHVFTSGEFHAANSGSSGVINVIASNYFALAVAHDSLSSHSTSLVSFYMEIVE